MSELDLTLIRFRRRVRLLQAWRGLAIGTVTGGMLSLVLAIMDWRGVWLISWPVLIGVIAGGAALGALIGASRRVSADVLARSIDRRAHLKDRLSTAMEPQPNEFEEAQREDALAKLKAVRPQQVFPVKVGPWQYGGLAMGILASLVFLLGNTPIGLSAAQRAEREELKKAAPEVERVAKPILEEPEPDLQDEKRLAEELKRFAEQLERGRKDRASALEEANELLKKADELTRRRFAESAESLEQAQTAMDAVLKQELQKQGMSPEQARAALEGLRESDDQARLEQQIAALEQQLRAEQNSNPQGRQDGRSQPSREKSGLSPEARKQLEEKLKNLKERLQNLELSKKAREFLDRLMSMPEFKELQEMAAKLRKAQEEVAETGRTELTEEQVKAMQERLDALAEKYKDDEAMRQLIREMMDAMKKGQGG